MDDKELSQQRHGEDLCGKTLQKNSAGDSRAGGSEADDIGSGRESLEELRQPPSNRLHKLSGDREGQWAIRINAQWRVCFEFDEATGDADAVQVSKHYE
jgi:hypothetical protein